MVSVVRFVSDQHKDGTIRALQRLRLSGVDYPPAADADNSDAALRSWLLDEPVLDRWVAETAGCVVGHVELSEPHRYLLDHLADQGSTGLPLAEIGKLFVAPEAQHKGVGAALLARARESAVARGRRTALAVLPSSDAGIRMYERAGMQHAGSFSGVHGLNYVMLG